MLQLFKKTKELSFERTYPAPLAAVWAAWTEAEVLQQWWAPDKAVVAECEVDLQLGGEIHIVMEATEAMGKYAGTRWPMVGTFTCIDPRERLTYEARSWTEGEEEGTTIHHVNDITFSEADGATTVRLEIAVSKIGPKAKMAAFGMKWGYKAYLDKLGEVLAGQG
ncbi:MAG: SRPBCC domain-containing protein [Acidimicrobiales bacterium]|nr:SRPBCC domain-containing protein [Acidimicrobiales bacterium]